MAKNVFFSFHYDDVASFRANVVRNHGAIKETGTAGFFDRSIWESAKKQNAAALKRLINDSLKGTSVTCALIGTHTWARRWVRYELLKSYDRDNLLLGVHINGVRDKDQKIYANGDNPFDHLGFVVSQDGRSVTYFERDAQLNWVEYHEFSPSPKNFAQQHWGKGFTLSAWVPIFDWGAHDGYNNFSTWVESAQ